MRAPHGPYVGILSGRTITVLWRRRRLFFFIVYVTELHWQFYHPLTLTVCAHIVSVFHCFNAEVEEWGNLYCFKMAETSQEHHHRTGRWRGKDVTIKTTVCAMR